MPEPQFLNQAGAGNFLQWAEGGHHLVDKQAGGPERLKDHFPLTDFAPDAADDGDSRSPVRKKCAEVGERVIKRGRLAFSADVQVEAPLMGYPRAGNDVVQGAQLPSSDARVANETVIAQVVIIVADKDIEDQSGEEFRVVAGDVRGVHVTADGVRQVAIAFIGGLVFRAAHQGKPTDKRHV